MGVVEHIIVFFTKANGINMDLFTKLYGFINKENITCATLMQGSNHLESKANCSTKEAIS